MLCVLRRITLTHVSVRPGRKHTLSGERLLPCGPEVLLKNKAMTKFKQASRIGKLSSQLKSSGPSLFLGNKIKSLVPITAFKVAWADESLVLFRKG